MRKYGQGWFNESRRHSLARHGVKTGRKINYYTPTYTSGDLPGIVTSGLGTAGASAVGWIPALVAVGATEKIVKAGKRMKKRINYYKISSISDDEKIYDVRQEIERKLKEKGISANVEVVDGNIFLRRVSITGERVSERGHNLQKRISEEGYKRTRTLSWEDWVDVNNTVNDVLDKHEVSAKVSSFGGKFDIRSKVMGRRNRNDWEHFSGENVGSQMYPIAREDVIITPEEGKDLGIKLNRKKKINTVRKDWKDTSKK